jgi:hypothetical protein
LPVYVGFEPRLEAFTGPEIFNAQSGQHVGNVSLACRLVRGWVWHVTACSISLKF